MNRKSFRAEDGQLITVLYEWDLRLRRRHVSVGAYPRRATDQEVLEAIELVLPRAGKAWYEHRHIVNPYVRHFFEQRKASAA